ncbi:MAG: NAD(P)H-dependent oxidoreductase subunit E, partial [Bacteroidales bacterium]|nr:NAD(P)H-dependent oxidoreductase subunit E [Bacteroidales bacterium]
MKKTKVIVGLGSCGIAAGANKVYDKIEALQKVENLEFELKKTSCVGMCYREPLVEIQDASGTYLYGDVDEDRIVEIIDKHIHHHDPVKEFIVRTDLFKTEDNEYVDNQVKIALRHCGFIDPESISDYENQQGYKALKKIQTEKIQPEQVIQTVIDSGLRGRGGGGFPTGLKWKFAFNSQSDVKYLICNADEGDPGAFMDRSLLEGDPHAVIEGMIIGAFAIGATE